MDLIFNSAFRILKEQEPSSGYLPGIYRVILDAPTIGRTIAVLISPEDPKPGKGGRKKKNVEDLKQKRRKPPEPLVGNLIWMERDELIRLSEKKLLKPHSIERRFFIAPSGRNKSDYEHRKKVMDAFLDQKKIEESILIHGGLGEIVDQTITEFGVSKSFVYSQWSNLCRWGFDEKSLRPRRDSSGGSGIKRPCDLGSDNKPIRKKAGRKTTEQKVALAYGVVLEPDQPGITSEWAAAIRAADNLIPTPKPSWTKRCELITRTAFCAKSKEVDGVLTLVKPDFGTYPNRTQIQRTLTVGKTNLERLIERTTKSHFKMAMRGLIARNWQGVAGPGHTWAIDSTVGDVYLRSSVNRAWIVGRPIVYIIVDVWSTAVVGFYVCLSGPSWNTAKISLFNAVADPALLGKR